MNEVPGIISSVQNHWHFASLCVLAITVILYFYWRNLKGESEAILQKARELDEARALLHKQDFDRQIDMITGFVKTEMASISKRADEIDLKTNGVGNSLDKYREDSTKKFDKFEVLCERIDRRLKILEENSIKGDEFKDLRTTVQKTEILVAGIDARMESLIDSMKELKTVCSIRQRRGDCETG